MTITPTSHTARTVFFPEGADDPSFDEQSSIDASNFIEASSHTASLRTGNANAADSSVGPSRRDRSISVAGGSVLASVLEEPCQSMDEPTNSSLLFPLGSAGVDTPTSSMGNVPNTNGSTVPTPVSPTGTATSVHGGGAASASPSSPADGDDESSFIPVSPKNPTTYHTRMDDSSSSFPQPSSVPSRTMHTSNVNPETYQRLEEESEQFAAWVIHVCLIVFGFLVVSSIILTVFVVGRYGFVTFVALFVVLLFAIGLLWFVDQTILRKDARLKPIRAKLIRAVHVAKQAMVEEFQLFRRDWNEHLLLMEGGRHGTTSTTMEEEDGRDDMESSSNNSNNNMGTARWPQPAKKKKRSIVFKLVRPLVRWRPKFRRGGRKKEESVGTESYEPPTTAISEGVAV